VLNLVLSVSVSLKMVLHLPCLKSIAAPGPAKFSITHKWGSDLSSLPVLVGEAALGAAGSCEPELGPEPTAALREAAFGAAAIICQPLHREPRQELQPCAPFSWPIKHC
jgi:hypothetical protein